MILIDLWNAAIGFADTQRSEPGYAHRAYAGLFLCIRAGDQIFKKNRHFFERLPYIIVRLIQGL